MKKGDTKVRMGLWWKGRVKLRDVMFNLHLSGWLLAAPAENPWRKCQRFV